MKLYDRYDFTNTRQLLEQFVQSGGVAGASLQITRRGETILETEVGCADRERNRQMAPDTIFRLFSMTKPVTAILFMILYERGLVHLKDPVSDFLPGFRDASVYVQNPDGGISTEKARAPLTLYHLLTMTSGIPYQNDDTPTSRDIGQILQFVAADLISGTELSLPDIANRIGKVPLLFQPGERWQYGLSLDIIGAVIEVVAGRKLGQLMQEEIFEPLGMHETGFSVPEPQKDRLAGLYAEVDGKLTPDAPGLLPGDPCQPPLIEYGGAGLFSTRSDYTRFARMLLGGGELDGCRILSRKTIELMRSDHLTTAQKSGFNWDNQRGYSYGLAVRTLVSPALAGSLASPGEFGWDGAAGTWFAVDPQEDLTAVYMVQRLPAGHIRFIPRLMATIYAAL